MCIGADPLGNCAINRESCEARWKGADGIGQAAGYQVGQRSRKGVVEGGSDEIVASAVIHFRKP